MNNPPLLQVILAYFWVFILASGTINHLYASFSGITILDRFFSKMINPEWESRSPFDGFYRLHKYSFSYTFGLNRPKVSTPISIWLYFTCFSLSVIWISLAIGLISKYYNN